MFEIEKGVEIPNPKTGPNSRYPFATMGVGDSFFVPNESAISVRNAAQMAGKRSGRKFCVRKVDGGARVWRTN